jgi:mono/diheme cytochrome c family protein
MISKTSGSKLLKQLGWVVLLSSSAVFLVMADGDHEQGNDNKTVDGSQATQHDQHGSMSMEGGASHAHKEWVSPPDEYADKKSNRWADVDAIVRGKKLYEQNCVSCHGQNGRGTGPMAAALSHPPADLTNHFHKAPSEGDAYLFWRISEGGTVEPFKSMGSAMIPFKNMLNENERWDTLAYVHAFFHLGLAQWSADAKIAAQPEAGKHADKSEQDTMSTDGH